jgi:methionyl-tRNA formyltransferase
VSLAPGELRASKTEVLAGTGTHAVALGEVQPPGKKRMKATDWVRGIRLTEEDRLV